MMPLYLDTARHYFDLYDQNVVYQWNYWEDQMWKYLFLAAEAGEI